MLKSANLCGTAANPLNACIQMGFQLDLRIRIGSKVDIVVAHSSVM